MHSKADMPSNNTSTKSQSNQHDNSNPSPSCNSINQVRQIDSTTDNNKNIIIAKTNGFRKLSGKRDLFLLQPKISSSHKSCDDWYLIAEIYGSDNL